MNIARIAVFGAGQMGAGIAQVAAQSGFETVVCDIDQRFLDAGRMTIEKYLGRAVERGRMTDEQRRSALGRVEFTLDPATTLAADVVIEAIVENKRAKQELFRSLDNSFAPTAIFASNTSSLSITELAAATRRPDRFIGLHFMNPVPVIPLVEVVRGQRTSDETFRAIEQLAQDLGKTAVSVSDYPGFICNRLLVPMINEAVFCLMEGVATRQDIDTVTKLGMNHPMGPLALADLIGLDTVLAIMEVLYDGYRDSKYRPCPLLVRKVNAGELGRKTGKGFYEY